MAGLVGVGHTIQFQMMIQGQPAGLAYWRTSDARKLESWGGGSFIARKPGRVTILARFLTIAFEAEVEILTREAYEALAAQPLKLSLESTTLRRGQSAALELRWGIRDVTASAVWRVDKPEVARILDNGRVRGLAPGEVSLSASIGGKQVQVKLTVR